MQSHTHITWDVLQQTGKRVKIQGGRNICAEKHVDLIPEMPPLIPISQTDKLKLNILDKIKLVASMDHVLSMEHKLEMLWKERQRRTTKEQKFTENKKIEPGTVIKHTEEVRQFRQFWRFYESFEDDKDGDDVQDDEYPVSIEDLVVDEVQKYRARNKHLDDNKQW